MSAICEAAGSEKLEVYSLEYIEDFFGPRTMQIGSFAAVNGHVGQAPRLRWLFRAIDKIAR